MLFCFSSFLEQQLIYHHVQIIAHKISVTCVTVSGDQSYL